MHWLVVKLNPAIEQENVGLDYRNLAQRSDVVKDYFRRETSAVMWAQKQATLNPGQQYAVMGVLKIFETTTPTVIEKYIDDRGQILPVSGKAKPA